MNPRKILFWAHFTVGAIAGLLILNMALTGAILAFEPQIINWAERDLQRVVPPTMDAPRLAVDALLEKARVLYPESQPSAVTLRVDPTSTVTVGFGKESGTLYINPYSGAVLGQGSKTRDFFHQVEEWHRWFGKKDVGQKITGAACLAFLFMLCSGMILWWPKALMRLIPNLHGKTRDWNWHNVVGSWFAPIILMTTLTGTIMSYRWANNLLFTVTGNKPPLEQKVSEQPKGGAVPRNITPHTPQKKSQAQILPTPIHWDALVVRAQQQVPSWVSLQLRLPKQPDNPVVISIESSSVVGPNPRSILTIDGATAEVVKWEPYAEQNLGKKLRAWVKPLHIGTAFGWVGQTLVFFSSLGALVLIYTGFALAWRRLRS